MKSTTGSPRALDKYTYQPLATSALARQTHADSDDLLIERWLFGRGRHTQRAYRSDIARFDAFVARPFREVTLDDLQAFAEALEAQSLSPASRCRTLAAVKGLLGFGHRLGYLPFDVSRALRVPRQTARLSERILTEAQTQRLLALAESERDRVLLRLLYAAGLRVSEAAALRWRDVQPRAEAGQVTVLGKGDKIRAVLLPRTVWDDLDRLRDGAGTDEPIFRSRQGAALSATQIRRVVLAAAKRAGITGRVSPHWLRHAHPTHALERGAPIHLVQATLGHASVATTGRYLHARPTASSAQYLAL